MEENGWYEGPEWLLTREDWPPQPSIKCTPRSQEEEKPLKDIVAYTREETPTKTKEQVKASAEEQETDEWDELLLRNTYWRVLRITAWIQDKQSCKVKEDKEEVGPTVHRRTCRS